MNNKTVKVAPSILAADFAAMGAAVQMLEQNGAEYVHVDVMDGAFVPNISFGQEMVKALRRCTKLVLDVHLMVEKPERYVQEFIDAGADIVTVHAEATTHLQRTLAAIRQGGAKAGLALNPATPLNVTDYVMNDVDMFLLMSVNPGFGGQKFIPAVLDKIADLRAKVTAAGLDTDIEVDGGIGPDNVDGILAAGANVIVAGSAVFKAADPAAVIARLHG